MVGWRVGYMVGNKELVAALAASRATTITAPSRPSRWLVIALDGPRRTVSGTPAVYRTAATCRAGGAARGGLDGRRPRPVDVHLGQDPEAYQEMGPLEFAKKLLAEAKVAVSPGVGSGEYGG